ncbi:uncharacterized protein LOC133195132 [Saccostrea echinata]|uniref:uncharacterized protein LOC133195132 n=1 Tax=Saccostrea echinata TaxID=191078 RepID=UPI002A82F2D2|nr:uncharacterized protein LOC133195132 [Saccostrea echinata]
MTRWDGHAANMDRPGCIRLGHDDKAWGVHDANMGRPGMFCIECGSHLEPNNKFCGECGTAVKKKSRVADTRDITVPSEAEQKPSGSGSTGPFKRIEDEGVKSKLDFLRAKFITSKKKMIGTTFSKESEKPECLEIRFLDQNEKRIQRLFNGVDASMILRVEKDSSMDNWMQSVENKFKTSFTMVPMRLEDKTYTELPRDLKYQELKKRSKGKRKYHGFYVKIYARSKH